MTKNMRLPAAVGLALALAGTAHGQTYSRTETLTYSDNLAKWVIGQTAGVTCVSSVPSHTSCDGDAVSVTTFDSGSALPTAVSSFGKTQSTMSYNSDGTLATVTDGRGKTTTLSGWKRGVPQKISYADGRSRSAVVNSQGWIGSVTDENGYMTAYGYDGMGRLAGTTYPTGDSVLWAPTTRSFAPIAAVEYGIAAGHWRETVTTGNATKVTYYDAFWRPLLVREYDSSDLTTERFVKTAYDAGGRLAFTSYPSASSSPSTGVWSEYDALDRVTSVSQDSEQGLLTTVTQYLSGFHTRTSGPRPGVETTVGYMAYDQPTVDWPVVVAAPENTTTSIVRDPFGKPLSLTRSGGATTPLTRSYTYNDAQELCRSVEPETGATLFGYDGAGNLSWSAAGLPAATACSDAGNTSAILARKVSRSYDNRNRLSSLVFPDHLGDQSWLYTADGRPSQISTANGAGGTVVNSYVYNRRRLLTGETQQHDIYSWSVGYGYDSIAHQISLVYPAGLTLNYTTNALGQVTKVEGGGRIYASGATYYPNGSLKQFTYGNGIVHTMQQNARQLPMRATSSGGVLDYGYTYDQAANVTGISDLARGVDYTRSMTYDGLDRLLTAQSQSFGGTDGLYRFSYDALDNLKSWQQAGGDDYAAYLYEAETNRLTNIRNTANASAVAFEYDLQGNVTQKNGQTYVFDFGNRLRSAVGKESYRYDGYGRRVLSDASSGKNFSLYSIDGTLLWQRDDVNGKRRQHIYLAGSRIAQRARPVGTDTENITFYHTDALGSASAVTDSTAQVISRPVYEPYGSVVGAPSYQGIGYAGHVMDGATSLTYMQQRYYDPTIGRFLSVDPVAARQSGDNFNRYAYAFNNPYKFTDPDGREGACMYGPSMCGMRETSPEVRAQQEGMVEGLASFIPGVDAFNCASSGCGKAEWAMAGMAMIPGDGKVAQIGTRITRASLNRVKALVRALSRAEAKAKPLGQVKVEKLERIVEKAGGTLRNDGDAGVKGSSAGTPHVQTEGLGNKTDSRHVWTEPEVKLKNEK